MNSDGDLEAAGLLGAPGELDTSAREARIALVRSLLDDGATTAELREAVAEDRLVLLPLERTLRTGGVRRTAREVGELTGLSLDTVDRLRETLGLSVPDHDESAFGEVDLRAFEQAALAMEAGLPLEGVLEVNLVLAATMPGLAATLRQLAATEMATSDDERSAALELAGAARDLLPVLMPVLEYALRAHLESQVTGDFVESGLDRDVGGVRAVAFADLEGFTALSERSESADVGTVSERLTQLARSVVSGRVRLVKTIGDAVMLTAPTPAELVPAVLDLVAAVAGVEDLPRLHVGVAHGESVQRAGDIFGRTVNRASRLADVATAGTVVCDAAAYDALEGTDLDLVALEPVSLKGVDGPQPVWRVGRAGRRCP